MSNRKRSGFKGNFLFLCIVLCLTSIWGFSQEQQKFLPKVEDSAKVNGLGALNSLSLSSFTTVETEFVGLPVLGGQRENGHLTVSYDQPITTNMFTILEFKHDSSFFGALKSDGLLSSGLLFTVTLSDSSGTVVHRFDSKNGVDAARFVPGIASGGLARIIIKADRPYQKVRIDVNARGVLNTSKYSLNIKSIYAVASVNGAGGDWGVPVNAYRTLSGNILGGGGVEFDNTLVNAFDNNSTTAAEISSGGIVNISLGSSNTISFNFSSRSKSGDTFRVNLGSKGQSLIGLSFGDIRITAYDGARKVYQRSFDDGFVSGLSILGAFGRDGKLSLAFAPGKPFDRVDVSLGKFFDATIIGKDVLSIYEIRRYAASGDFSDPEIVTAEPSVSPFSTPLCANSLGDNENTDFPASAVDGNNETFAKINKGGSLTFGFEDELPAYTTSYMRLDLEETTTLNGQVTTVFRKDILEFLSEGSLGRYKVREAETLITNTRFDISIVNSGQVTVASGSSSDGFKGTTGGSMHIVKDEVGRYYLALTPNRSYSKVIVKNLASTSYAGVSLLAYDLCTEMDKAACGLPLFTSTTAEGNSLNFAKLSSSGASVTGKERLLSSQDSTPVLFNIGNNKDVTAIKQSIYFGQSTPNRSKLAIDIRLLNPTFSKQINGQLYKLKLYLGGLEVETLSLLDGIPSDMTLDVVLASNALQSFVFNITKSYDRIDFVVEGANAPLLELYQVQRICNDDVSSEKLSNLITPVCMNYVLEGHNVERIQDIKDGNLNTGAILNTQYPLAPGVLGSVLRLAYSESVPANTVSYLPIRFSQELIAEKLLQAALGQAGVENILDLEVKVLRGNNMIFSQSTSRKENNKGFSNSVRVVQDTEGIFYLAVMANEEYDNISVVLKRGSSNESVEVFIGSMCYEGDVNACALPFAAFGDVTDINGNGFTGSVPSGVGVLNMTDGMHLKEGAEINSAKLSLGNATGAISVNYHVIFNSLSMVSDLTEVGLRLPSTANVDLEDLAQIKIVALLKGNEVGEYLWSEELFEQLKGGEEVRVQYAVGQVYDQIVVRLQQNNLRAIRALEVTGVKRLCKPALADLVTWKSYKIYKANSDISVVGDFSDGKYTIEGELSEFSSSVKGGEFVEYTIHIRNTGEEPLSGFIVTDPLPEGMKWIAGGVLFDKTVTLNSQEVLEHEKELVLSFVVKVDEYLLNEAKEEIEKFVNIAEVVSDRTTGSYLTYPAQNNLSPTEPNTNQEGGVTIYRRDHYALEVHKTGVTKRIYGSNGSLNPFYWWDNILEAKANEIEYTIEVKNTGNKLFTSVDVIDNFLRNDHVVAGEKGSGEFKLNSSKGVSEHNITYGNLNVGETAQYTFSVKTNNNYKGTLIHNEVTATGKEGSENKVQAKTDFKIDGQALRGVSGYEENIATVDFIEFSGPLELCAEDDEAHEFSVRLSNQAFRMNGQAKVALEYPVFKWFDKNPELDEGIYGEHKPIFIGERLVKKFEETTTLYLVVEGYHWRPNMHIGDVRSDYPDMGALYTPKEVTIYVHDIPEKPVIQLVGDNAIESSGNTVTVCSGGDVVLTTQEEAVGYQWYFNGNIIDNDYGRKRELVVYAPGQYSVVATNGRCGSAVSDEFVVNFLPVASLSFDRKIHFLPLTEGVAKFTLPEAITKIVTGEESQNATLPVQWFDHKGMKITDINSPYVFTDFGTYTFTATTTTVSGCGDTESITIIVTGADGCPPEQKRVYATSDGWGTTLIGWVSNRERAYDQKLDSHSTITVGVGLLGLGTTWQNIYFDEVVPAGTPLHIKLGKEYSAVDVASAITVVGLDERGNTIGTLKAVDGDVLTLLSADNIIEYSFVPSDNSGPKNYKGVRVILGAAVAVATSMKVYEVYYETTVSDLEGGSEAGCLVDGMNNSVKDLLFGVKAPLGLNVASATSAVSNPWNAVDDNMDSYATISRVVAVANSAYLTAVFKQVVMPTDELHITVDMADVPVLSLSLLEGVKIQRFMGDQPIGEAINVKQGVLDLTLLGINYKGRRAIIVVKKDEGASYQPYDRVQISYGTVLSVLGEFIRIYDVSVVPSVALDYIYAERNEDDTSVLPDPGYQEEVCLDSPLVIPHYDDCTTVEVFKNEIGNECYDVEYIGSGGGVHAASLVSLGGLSPGEYTVYVQNRRYGCAIGPRIPVKVKINEPPKIYTYTLNDKELAVSYQIVTRANRLLKLGTTNSHVTILRWLVKQGEEWVDLSQVFNTKAGKVGEFSIPFEYREQTIYLKPEIQEIGNEQIGCIGFGNEISVEIKGSINRIKTNLNITNRINGKE